MLVGWIADFEENRLFVRRCGRASVDVIVAYEARGPPHPPGYSVERSRPVRIK